MIFYDDICFKKVDQNPIKTEKNEDEMLIRTKATIDIPVYSLWMTA